MSRNYTLNPKPFKSKPLNRASWIRLFTPRAPAVTNHIYIYIYIYRERERHIYTYIYIYIHTYIFVTSRVYGLGFVFTTVAHDLGNWSPRVLQDIGVLGNIIESFGYYKTQLFCTFCKGSKFSLIIKELLRKLV